MSPDDIALFRFHLIAEALNPHLSPAERGWLVRELVSRSHPHPDGGLRAYSRNTFDRWIRAYREQGLDGLRPIKRADSGSVRRHPELIGEAAALRAELPGRSAAAIADILFVRHRVVVSPRTIRSHLRRRGLQRAALIGSRRAFGRYEAERPNERWIGDVLVGPFVPHPRVAGSKRAKLFLLVDDHSRLLIHGAWMTEENTRAGQDVLRSAICRRGLPESLYLGNGAPFSNHMLERTCGVLGVRLIHSKPRRSRETGTAEPLYPRTGSSPKPNITASEASMSSTTGSWPGRSKSPTSGSMRRPTSDPWTASLPVPCPACPTLRSSPRRSAGR